MFMAAALGSIAFPGLGYFLSNLQFIYYGGQDDPEGEWLQEKNKMLWQFFGFLFFCIFFFGFNAAIFGYMGERITFSLRMQLYEETLHKQISWFDRQERAPGVITSVFSENMEAMRGMTTETLVKYFEAGLTFTIGLAAGIYFCPE